MDYISEFLEWKSKQENSKGKLRSPATILNYGLQLRIYEKGSNAIKENLRSRTKHVLNTKAYIYQLKDKYSKDSNSKGNSYKTHIAIIKSYHQFLISEKRLEVPAVEWQALKQSINLNKTEKAFLSTSELMKLKTFIRDVEKTSLRDRLIFEIALDTAARRGEIQSLKNNSFYTKEYQNGTIGYFVDLKRKGKQHLEAAAIPERLYLLVKEFNNNVNDDSFLFKSKRSKINDGLNLAYISQLVSRVSKEALGYSLSPHYLRNSSVNQLILHLAKKGYSLDKCLTAAQKLCGHSSSEVTRSHYFNHEVLSLFNTLSQDLELIEFSK
jgi:integrase